MALLPLLQLAQRHEIVAVVRPDRPWVHGRLRWAAAVRRLLRPRPDPLAHFIGRHRIPSLWLRPGRVPDLVAQLTRLRPDLGCIATFPWLLAPAIFTLPAYGTINLHPSLLPRHRGPTPLFWVYYRDDRQTGVTVHEVTERADAGAILAQEAFPLPRGCNVRQLHHTKAARGAALLLQAVSAIETGGVRRLPQEEPLATPAPRVPRGRSMVDFATWDVERVWHFLTGLYPQFCEPLRDQRGRAVRYRHVVGYVTQEHPQRPGSIVSTPYGWDVYCQGGVVQLAHTKPRDERLCGEGQGLTGAGFSSPLL